MPHNGFIRGQLKLELQGLNDTVRELQEDASAFSRRIDAAYGRRDVAHGAERQQLREEIDQLKASREQIYGDIDGLRRRADQVRYQLDHTPA